MKGKNFRMILWLQQWQDRSASDLMLMYKPSQKISTNDQLL